MGWRSVTSTAGGVSEDLGGRFEQNLLRGWLTDDTYPVRSGPLDLVAATDSVTVFVPRGAGSRTADPGPAGRLPAGPGGNRLLGAVTDDGVRRAVEYNCVRGYDTSSTRRRLPSRERADMTETRTALVTGGASGLGAASAERLRADGVHVITLDLAPGADLVVDVTDQAAVHRTAADVGPVDVLVNSAGIVGPGKPLVETTDEEWRRVLDVNVLGTVNTMRAFIPGMRERRWGRVVNFASMAGKDGNPNLSVYSASKAAVIALTKSAGKELATTGVLVNVIAPAVFATPMNDATDPDVLAHITSLIPMKRLGRPAEVAELVAFLASDRVSFSTGAVYDISGGRATY
jgi:3-oxoacyl-[acyl-carrier protein] reductase